MIFTFSVPETEQQKLEAVEAVKEHCRKHNLKFSGLVVQLLREWAEANNVRKQ